jgi:hypothetical protein
MEGLAGVVVPRGAARCLCALLVVAALGLASTAVSVARASSGGTLRIVVAGLPAHVRGRFQLDGPGIHRTMNVLHSTAQGAT